MTGSPDSAPAAAARLIETLKTIARGRPNKRSPYGGKETRHLARSALADAGLDWPSNGGDAYNGEDARQMARMALVELGQDWPRSTPREPQPTPVDGHGF